MANGTSALEFTSMSASGDYLTKDVWRDKRKIYKIFKKPNPP